MLYLSTLSLQPLLKVWKRTHAVPCVHVVLSSTNGSSDLVTNYMRKNFCRAHWTLVLLLFVCHVPAKMKWDTFLFFLLLPLFTALCWINDQRCLTATLSSSSPAHCLQTRRYLKWSEEETMYIHPCSTAAAEQHFSILLYSECCRHGSLWSAFFFYRMENDSGKRFTSVSEYGSAALPRKITPEPLNSFRIWDKIFRILDTEGLPETL